MSNYLYRLSFSDIDFFKIFNDTYGHQEGDDCLIALASTIDEFLAEENYSLARYGGEEFVVILPETNAEKVNKDSRRNSL
ncbi:diguanylate cyclase [Anaerobacillus sp. HL2]|nr:diguanylate cyclase [Anaerobacillus sp. HL2]